jgi:serine/threonine protein kinase
MGYGAPSPGRSSRTSSRLLSRQALAIGVLAADALQAAHEAGVCHGDLRPASMLINAAQEPVVSGFGFGLLYQSDRSEAIRLAHWSPALLEGGTPSHADDVYGLAATLATLLIGSPHLHSAAEDGLAPLIAAALAGRVPVFPDDVPAGVRSVLAAALSPNPAARPGSARELGGALRDATNQAGRRLAEEEATPADDLPASNGASPSTAYGPPPAGPPAGESPGPQPAHDDLPREEQALPGQAETATATASPLRAPFWAPSRSPP